MKTSVTINDLILLRGIGVALDPEDLQQVQDYENKHRDFVDCRDCGAKTFEQHDFECPRASILWLDDWYELLQQRERLGYS